MITATKIREKEQQQLASIYPEFFVVCKIHRFAVNRAAVKINTMKILQFYVIYSGKACEYAV